MSACGGIFLCSSYTVISANHVRVNKVTAKDTLLKVAFLCDNVKVNTNQYSDVFKFMIHERELYGLNVRR